MFGVTRAVLLRVLRDTLARLERSAARPREHADQADVLFVQVTRQWLDQEESSSSPPRRRGQHP